MQACALASEPSGAGCSGVAEAGRLLELARGAFLVAASLMLTQRPDGLRLSCLPGSVGQAETVPRLVGERRLAHPHKNGGQFQCGVKVLARKGKVV